MMRVVRQGLCVLVFVALALPALAQTPTTSALAVVLHDAAGAAVADAKITLLDTETGTSRDGRTGKDGAATVAGLSPTGLYTISISKPGVNADDIEGIRIASGELATLTVKLAAEGGKTTTTLSSGTTGVRRDAATGLRLQADTIGETPILGRRVTTLPLLNSAFRPAKTTADLYVPATLFVGGAGGRLQTTFLVDGSASNEPRSRQTLFVNLPLASVQQMDVLMNPISVEYGWTSGPAVNIITKAGANATHGDMLLLWRPGRIQSASMGGGVCPSSITTCAPTTLSGFPITLLAPDRPDSMWQGSVAAGGAIMEDQTFFFASGDYSRQNRTTPVTSLIVPAGTTAVGNVRDETIDVRIDHKLSDTHMLMGHINVDRTSDTNPADTVGFSVVPGAGVQDRRRTLSAVASDRRIFSRALFNDLRVTYSQGDPISQFAPTTPSVQFVRIGPVPFVSGESRAVDAKSRQTEITDTLTWTRGRHTIRFGGGATYDAVSADGTEFGNGFTYGQFTIDPTTIVTLTDLTIANAISYRQTFNFGATTADVKQWLATGYVQDTFRAGPNLTLDLGLRYDHQSTSDANGDAAPRFGLAWSPHGSQTTIVRAGYGLYYSMIPARNIADFTLNGPEGILAFTAFPGDRNFPTSLGTVPVVFDQTEANAPARDITIRPGMRSFYEGKIAGFDRIADCGATTTALCYPASLVNPRSQVVSGGIERRLGPHMTLAADYVHQAETHLLTLVDLNAPSLFARTAPGQVRTVAAADATRPIVPAAGGFRTIDVLENAGSARYDGVTATLRLRRGERFQGSISYTLSRTSDTTEPDGSLVGPNDQNQRGEIERGPSIFDQRHRVVLNAEYTFFRNVVFGALVTIASPLPLNAITGVDNNGDGLLNDRPVVNGQVIGPLTFRGTPTANVTLVLEKRYKFTGGAFILRGEGFNIFNHADVLGRNTVYGDGATASSTFGQALMGMANLDPGRTFQFIMRVVF